MVRYCKKCNHVCEHPKMVMCCDCATRTEEKRCKQCFNRRSLGFGKVTNYLTGVFYESLDSIRGVIQLCTKDDHVQQVAFSTHHDSLTQICFSCRCVRTNMKTAAFGSRLKIYEIQVEDKDVIRLMQGKVVLKENKRQDVEVYLTPNMLTTHVKSPPYRFFYHCMHCFNLFESKSDIKLGDSWICPTCEKENPVYT